MCRIPCLYQVTLVDKQLCGFLDDIVIETEARRNATGRDPLCRDVKNANNENVGEIKSIYIGNDDKVGSVIVGIGGFPGLGEREVRLAWKDLIVLDNGEKVIVNMSKDELAARPEYKYGDPSWRGQVFGESGPWKPDDSLRPAETAAAEQVT